MSCCRYVLYAEGVGYAENNPATGEWGLSYARPEHATVFPTREVARICGAVIQTVYAGDWWVVRVGDYGTPLLSCFERVLAIPRVSAEKASAA